MNSTSHWSGSVTGRPHWIMGNVAQLGKWAHRGEWDMRERKLQLPWCTVTAQAKAEINVLTFPGGMFSELFFPWKLLLFTLFILIWDENKCQNIRISHGTEILVCLSSSTVYPHTKSQTLVLVQRKWWTVCIAFPVLPLIYLKCGLAFGGGGRKLCICDGFKLKEIDFLGTFTFLPIIRAI